MITHIFKSFRSLLLNKEAELVLKKYKPKVVVIKGVGKKAPTRHAVETALSKFYFVRSGVDRVETILGSCGLVEGLALIILPNHYPEWLIFESDFIKPDYVVDADEVKNFEYKDYEVVYWDDLPTGMSFKVIHDNVEYPIQLQNMIGESNTKPILSAFELAKSLGHNLSAVPKAFDHYEAQDAHNRLIQGIKGSLVIVDTFDSSPASVVEGLKALKSLNKSKRRIAMVGDMLSVGSNSVEEHKKIGHEITKEIDMLVTVGIRSKYVAETALQNGFSESKVFQFDEPEEVREFVKNLIEAGDVLYVTRQDLVAILCH